MLSIPRNNRRLEATRPTTSSHTRTINRDRRSDLDQYKCVLCKRSHGLRFCRKFLKMNPKKREEIVERYRCCLNCLAQSHDLRACSSMDTCRVCSRFHHTLLHPRRRRARAIKREESRPQRYRQQPSPNRSQSQPNQQQSREQSNLSTTADTKIIVEAIRSLACVLCVQEHKPT